MNRLAHNPKQFRGYSDVNKIIHERIIANRTFAIGAYLGRNSEHAAGLAELLGTYSGSEGEGSFRNGNPNSLNMILWYLVMSGLSQSIANQLQDPLPPYEGGTDNAPPVVEFRLEFLSVLKPFKTWPHLSGDTRQILENYWVAIMGYDAPESEFKVWVNMCLGSSMVALPPIEFVKAATLAALYNPYFLLGVS